MYFWLTWIIPILFLVFQRKIKSFLLPSSIKFSPYLWLFCSGFFFYVWFHGYSFQGDWIDYLICIGLLLLTLIMILNESLFRVLGLAGTIVFFMIPSLPKLFYQPTKYQMNVTDDLLIRGTYSQFYLYEKVAFGFEKRVGWTTIPFIDGGFNEKKIQFLWKTAKPDEDYYFQNKGKNLLIVSDFDTTLVYQTKTSITQILKDQFF